MFPVSYHQTIHTFQGLYAPILIFLGVIIIHIFHSSYKPLLTNKTLKNFSELLSNNISISES